MERKEAVVMYPSPVIGHLVSMVELAKLLLTHQPSLSIHILIATPPYQPSSTAAFVAATSAMIPSITFHRLPEIFLSPATISLSSHHEILTLETLRLSCPYVHKALMSLTRTTRILALIMDFFCMPALEIASQLNIPGYYFFTSGAGILACLSYLSTLHARTTKSFKELTGALIDIPGLPPIPSSDMAKPLMQRNDKTYEYFLDFSLSLSKSSGVIVNTFEALEPRALEAVSIGNCSPDSATTIPPVYSIGPLISGSTNSNGVMHACMTWLDMQPSHSVVFLCFGSLGMFSKQQLHEIAIGLEQSNQRFIWVVRTPASQNQNVAVSDLPEPNLDILLPEGFQDRTKDRGLVIKTWAPQPAVLKHASVGGFVTHCGWNSVLEAVCAGVAMVAWPLYAEQRFNRVVMVEEMKIALRMNEEAEGEIVCADEVEKRVRELMEGDEGKIVRENVKRLKCEAERASRNEGTSRVALRRLVENWKK